MTTCEPANGYLPVPGPTSLCAYLAILITCGTVILLTWSWGAIGKLVSLLKVVCQVRDRRVPGNIVHLRSSYLVHSVLGGL